MSIQLPSTIGKNGGEIAQTRQIVVGVDRHKSPERNLRLISRAVNCTEPDQINPLAASGGRKSLGSGTATIRVPSGQTTRLHHPVKR